MNESIFKAIMLGIAVLFSVFFVLVVVPPLINNPDVWAALSAGFVNPFASGYSTDVILCWITLAVWIFYEAKQLKIKNSWICALLGLVPGVAVGFPQYLILRHKQLKHSSISA